MTSCVAQLGMAVNDCEKHVAIRFDMDAGCIICTKHLVLSDNQQATANNQQQERKPIQQRYNEPTRTEQIQMAQRDHESAWKAATFCHSNTARRIAQLTT